MWWWLAPLIVAAVSGAYSFGYSQGERKTTNRPKGKR